VIQLITTHWAYCISNLQTSLCCLFPWWVPWSAMVIAFLAMAIYIAKIIWALHHQSIAIGHEESGHGRMDVREKCTREHAEAAKDLTYAIQLLRARNAEGEKH